MAGSKRISVFIDGANLNRAQGKYRQGYKVDLVRLIDRLVSVKGQIALAGRHLVAIHYYGSERGSKQTRFAKVRGVYNFQFHQCRFEKQVDVDIAVDMLDDGWRDIYDTVLLVSGGQDFANVAKRIKGLSKELVVASFENSLSSSLRKAASDVIVLDLYADYIRMA